MLSKLGVFFRHQQVVKRVDSTNEEEGEDNINTIYGEEQYIAKV
jgi:hypothetical protein